MEQRFWDDLMYNASQWGLLTYEPLKALQLALHYARSHSKAIGSSSLSLSSFEGFLLVAKEVFCLIRPRFPDARAKLDECLQEIRASGPRSLVEATSRHFGPRL